MRTTSMVLDAAEQSAPVVSEENDRLLWLKECREYLGEMLVDPWPGLRVWRRQTNGEPWEEYTEPGQYLLLIGYAMDAYRPAEVDQSTSPCPQALSWTDFTYWFTKSIPSHLALYARFYGDRYWRVLQAFRELGHPAEDLCRGNGFALLFMLAHLDRFGPDRIHRWERARSLIRMPQRHALAELGFAGTESVARILRKVPNQSCLWWALRNLRWILRREPARRTLCHLTRINVGVICLLRNPELSKVCTLELLEEVGSYIGDVSTPITAWHLRDILSCRNELNVSIPDSFRTIAEIEALHEGLFIFRRRRRPVVDFPEPPIQGLPNRIEPIRTFAELLKEGAEMNHCIADYGHSITDGFAYVYRVLEDNPASVNRATVLLEPKDGESGWKIGDLRGISNSKVSEPTWNLADDWLTMSQANRNCPGPEGPVYRTPRAMAGGMQ